MITLTGLVCFLQFSAIKCLDVDQRGNYFMLAFLNGHNQESTNSITITSEYEADVHIFIPSINERIKRRVQPKSSLQIKLDYYPDVTSVGEPELKGISVLSSRPVSVYGNILRNKSSEGYLAIPVKALSTRYRAFSFSVDGDNSLGQIGVIGVQNDTSVVFNYKPGTTCNSRTYIRETINTYTVNAYEVLKMTCESNMTGILVHSTKPVALLTGQDCPNSDVGQCSHLIEMAIPTSSFDTSFILQPSVSDSDFSIYRIVTNDQSASVSLSSGETSEVSSEDFYDIKVYRDEPLYLESTNPIMIVEISGSHSFGKTEGDHFMSIVPSISGFSEFYLIDTTMLLFEERDFQAYITVLSTSFAMQFFSFVDGTAVTNITTSNFASATFPAKTSKIFVKSNEPFGVINYGFGSEGSYGYPGGMQFEDFSGTAECDQNTACGNAGGICVEIEISYRCFCPDEYWAPFCENDPTTTEANITFPTPDEQTTLSEPVTTIETISTYSSVGLTSMSTEQDSIEESSTLKTRHTTTSKPTSSNVNRNQNSTSEVPTTRPTTLMTPAFNTCICLCQVGIKNGEDAEDSTDFFKKELAVETRVLSATVRKKISISDERPSASSIGYIGVVVLIFVFGSIVTMDILTFVGNECTVQPALI